MCFGLFLGFLIGYYLFAQVHLKVVCQPSGKTLLDLKRGLLHEINFNLDTYGCESIGLSVKKSNIPSFSRGSGEIGGETEVKRNKSSPSSSTGPEGGREIPPPPSQSGAGYVPPQAPYEPPGAKKIELAEVFSLCSARVDPNSSFIDSQLCIIKDVLPYYIILDQNSTHIKTSFYEGIGFNETYDKLNPTAIFRLFIRTTGTEGSLQSIQFYGPYSNYFSIGDYIVTGDWITTVISINPDIPVNWDWTYVKFYMETTKVIYYLGDIWFFIAK
jgi:hypothetical protein